MSSHHSKDFCDEDTCILRTGLGITNSLDTRYQTRAAIKYQDLSPNIALGLVWHWRPDVTCLTLIAQSFHTPVTP